MIISLKRTVMLMIISCCAVMMLSITKASAAVDSSNFMPTKEYVVNDYANMLTPQFKQAIIQQNKAFQNTKQQPQIVVITVKSTNGQNINQFAQDLLAKPQWSRISGNKNNGILILFALNNGHNNLRVSTGDSVENLITNNELNKLFKQNKSLIKSNQNSKINQGLNNIFNSISNQLMHNYANGNASKINQPFKFNNMSKILVPITVVLIFFLTIIGLKAGKDDDKRIKALHPLNADLYYQAWYRKIKANWLYTNQLNQKELPLNSVIKIDGWYGVSKHGHGFLGGFMTPGGMLPPGGGGFGGSSF